jgi:ubiquinone/menaquinone biosynthesis C-methylase UbiE
MMTETPGMGQAGTISKEYFDEVVDRESRMDSDYAAKRVVLRLSKLRHPQEGDSILDVGCGTGVVTAAFSRMGLKATGIDVVPEFIQVATDTHPDIRYLVAAAERLPFASESFDFANLSSLLEHVQDWRQALSESARTLKTGGVLYVQTSNRLWPIQSEIRYLHGFGYLPAFLQRRIYTLVMKYRPELVGYTHLPAYHWLTYWQVARALRQLNLEPHSWFQLIEESDIPARFQKYARLIMAMRRSGIPVHPLIPQANLIVARKRRTAI